jgi:hypothetical protein
MRSILNKRRIRKVNKMGEKLLSYFAEAGKKGGITAQVKLAMMTKLSRQTAETAEDSPANISMFEEAMKKI